MSDAATPVPPTPPDPSEPPAGRVPDRHQRFASPRYLLRKGFLSLIGAKFHGYDHEGGLSFFTKMKGFRLREDLRLYADESMSEELLTISTRQVIDFSAGYDVHDAVSGEKVGSLKRKGFKSMIRDEWTITDAHEREIGVIREDSTMLALVRRFFDMAALIFPQAYHVEVDGRTVAVYKQKFNPIIHKMDIDFTSDTDGLLDPRLGIAAAVLLAAIEGRQD